MELLSIRMSMFEADIFPALRDARMERLLVSNKNPKFYKVTAWMPKCKPEESSKCFCELVRTKLENRFGDRHVDVVTMDVRTGYAGFFRADVKVMV